VEQVFLKSQPRRGVRFVEKISIGRTSPEPARLDSAAIASNVPLDIHGFPLASVVIEGSERKDAAPERALVNLVTPDYFRTMRIPLLNGSSFAPLNDTTNSSGDFFPASNPSAAGCAEAIRATSSPRRQKFFL